MSNQVKNRLATAGLLAVVLGMMLTFGYANGFDAVKDTVTVLVTTIVYIVSDTYRNKG